MRYDSDGDILHQYLKTLKDKPLDPDTERELIIKAQQGDKAARDKVIKANLKFVVYIVTHNFRPYLKQISINDMISAGNIGLLKALEKYDVSKQVKFATYAFWWIRQSIYREMVTLLNSVSIPEKASIQLLVAHSIYQRLREDMGREPSDEEIMDALQENGITVSDTLTVDRIKHGTMCPCVSIDVPIDIDDASQDDVRDTYAELYTSSYDTELLAIGKIESDNLYRVIEDVLSENEKYVVIHRYGLYNTEPESYVSIGKSLNVSTERVRQIEMKAIRKLKSALRKRKPQNSLQYMKQGGKKRPA